MEVIITLMVRLLLSQLTLLLLYVSMIIEVFDVNMCSTDGHDSLSKRVDFSRCIERIIVLMTRL